MSVKRFNRQDEDQCWRAASMEAGPKEIRDAEVDMDKNPGCQVVGGSPPSHVVSLGRECTENALNSFRF